jgi:anti-anti-sigma factor
MANSRKKAKKRTIRPGKDIVAPVVEDLKSKLLKLINQDIQEITVDFKGVEVIDSVGLGVLIATHNSIDEKEGILRIKNVSENLFSLFKTMRLDQHFEVGMAE